MAKLGRRAGGIQPEETARNESEDEESHLGSGTQDAKMEAVSLPDSKEGDSREDDMSTCQMKYSVPFRLDQLKTQWNPEADPAKWIKRVFAILKNADASAALLTQPDSEGKRRQYNRVSDIPGGTEMGFRIKKKQYRRNIQTLFGVIETKLTAREVKMLPGIKN